MTVSPDMTRAGPHTPCRASRRRELGRRSDMNVITVGKEPLTAEDVNRVAMGAAVRLHADAVSRIEAGRAVVEAALASGKAIYGLTTGVGRLKDTRLPDEELRRSQENLVRMHA